MMKFLILSFFVGASAIRVPQVHGGDSCDPRIKSIMQKHAVNNTVVFTGLDIPDDHDYEEMIQNYACSVRRVGLPLLVWSMNERTHAKMVEFGYPDIYQPTATVQFIKPMGQEYKQIVNTKPTQIKAVVDCGFNALFLDADLGIVQNPLPYFEAQKGDLQISSNYPQKAFNTGVVYARNTPQIAVLMDEWVKLKGKSFPTCGSLCGDQDALTHVVNASCGWNVHGSRDFVTKKKNKDPEIEAAEQKMQAQYVAAGETSEVSCSFLENNKVLKIDVLPLGKFANGKTKTFADEWYTYHPNFSGLKDGVMKRKKHLMTVIGHDHGKNLWCLEQQQQTESGQ